MLQTRTQNCSVISTLCYCCRHQSLASRLLRPPLRLGLGLGYVTRAKAKIIIGPSILQRNRKLCVSFATLI